MSQRRLTGELVEKRSLHVKELIAAFKKIDRADFVPEKLINEAYEDHALPIGHGQTISQPSTVAIMLELLAPKRGQKILDIGSGSGWTTAILAQVVGPKGQVIGVERIEELVHMGSANLKNYGFKWARIEQSSDWLGIPEEAPFDRILISAAADELPEEILEQLKTDGRLVLPIRNSIWLIEKQKEGRIIAKEYSGFIFVPLIVGRG